MLPGDTLLCDMAVDGHNDNIGLGNDSGDLYSAFVSNKQWTVQ